MSAASTSSTPGWRRERLTQIAQAIFGPGTVITTSAAKLMDILETQYGGTLTYTRAWALEREPWIT
jgi:hypothetical protein